MVYGSCGGTLVATGNGASVSPAVTTIYFGRYEDGAPCSFVTTCRQVTVTVNQPSGNPTSATASATTICNGQSTNLTLNGGGAGTGQIIRWYTGSCGGTLAATGNPASVSPTTTTTYFGRYEDGAPCNFNSTCAKITINVNSRPTANINSPNTSICNGGSTNITGTVTATGAWTLTLSGGGGTVTGTGNAPFSKSVSPGATTTYTITALSDAVCTSNASDRTGSTTVTVHSPVANAGPDWSLCSGSATIGGSPSATPASGAPYTYSWTSVPAGFTSTLSNPTVSPAVTTTYSLIVTDNIGCNSAANTAVVTIGASTKTWIGNGTLGGGPDNNFNNPFNWSPLGVPASCNDVVYKFAGVGNNSINSNVTINSLSSLQGLAWYRYTKCSGKYINH